MKLINPGSYRAARRAASPPVLAFYSGILAFVVGVGFFGIARDTQAAYVNCDLHSTPGTIGPIAVAVGIRPLADPGCGGTRSVIYAHRSVADVQVDWIGFEPGITIRGWRCGVLQYNPASAIGAGGIDVLAIDSFEISSNSCGFQADQNTKFSESPYSDTWIYQQY